MEDNYILCNETNFYEIMKDKNIKKILFTKNFNIILGRNIIPDNITHIKFNDSYQQYIDKDVLPKNLTHLYLGNNYNKIFDIDVLPKSLECLDVGISYNKPFKKGVLPFGLKELYLNNYNQDISNDFLPDTITHLYFSRILNTKGVKHAFCNFGDCNCGYKKSKIISFPKNLQFLNFDSLNYNMFDSNILPDGLHTLIINTKDINITKLPTTLINLKIGCSLMPGEHQKFSLFYTNIKKLHLDNYPYPIEKDTLPKNLEELHMVYCKSYLNKNVELDKLKIFTIRCLNNVNKDFYIPYSVEELGIPFNEKYNIVYNNLSLNIKEITLLDDQIRYHDKVYLDNLPITLEKIIIQAENIDTSKLKIPFGCQVINDYV